LATKAARAVMLYGFEDLNLPRIVRLYSLQSAFDSGYGKLGMHFEKMSTDHRGIEVVYYAKDKLGIRSTL